MCVFHVRLLLLFVTLFLAAIVAFCCYWIRRLFVRSFVSYDPLFIFVVVDGVMGFNVLMDELTSLYDHLRDDAEQGVVLC